MTTQPGFHVEIRSSKLKPRAEAVPEELPPHIIDVGFTGSREQCVSVTFSRGLTHEQQAFVEKALRRHDCREYIHDIRWRGNAILVVEVQWRSLQECSRVDVETAAREIARRLPPR